MQDIREHNLKYVVKCEHADVEDISSVAQILKDRTTSDSTSISIVYLFEYRKDRENLGKKYTSYDHLFGIVLCDHDILRRGPFDDVINEMVDCYKGSDFEYGCEFDMRGLVVRVKGWLYYYYDDREMLEVFDTLKNELKYEQALSPHSRTMVEYVVQRFFNHLEKKKSLHGEINILYKHLDIHEKFQLIDTTEEFNVKKVLTEELNRKIEEEIIEINDNKEMGEEELEVE
jgi:hypothetical protein